MGVSVWLCFTCVYDFERKFGIFKWEHRKQFGTFFNFTVLLFSIKYVLHLTYPQPTPPPPPPLAQPPSLPLTFCVCHTRSEVPRLRTPSLFAHGSPSEVRLSALEHN